MDRDAAPDRYTWRATHSRPASSGAPGARVTGGSLARECPRPRKDGGIVVDSYQAQGRYRRGGQSTRRVGLLRDHVLVPVLCRHRLRHVEPRVCHDHLLAGFIASVQPRFWRSRRAPASDRTRAQTRSGRGHTRRRRVWRWWLVLLVRRRGSRRRVSCHPRQ